MWGVIGGARRSDGWGWRGYSSLTSALLDMKDSRHGRWNVDGCISVDGHHGAMYRCTRCENESTHTLASARYTCLYSLQASHYYDDDDNMCWCSHDNDSDAHTPYFLTLKCPHFISEQRTNKSPDLNNWYSKTEAEHDMQMIWIFTGHTVDDIEVFTNSVKYSGTVYKTHGKKWSGEVRGKLMADWNIQYSPRNHFIHSTKRPLFMNEFIDWGVPR